MFVSHLRACYLVVTIIIIITVALCSVPRRRVARASPLCASFKTLIKIPFDKRDGPVEGPTRFVKYEILVEPRFIFIFFKNNPKLKILQTHFTYRSAPSCINDIGM